MSLLLNDDEGWNEVTTNTTPSKIAVSLSTSSMIDDDIVSIPTSSSTSYCMDDHDVNDNSYSDDRSFESNIAVVPSSLMFTKCKSIILGLEASTDEDEEENNLLLFGGGNDDDDGRHLLPSLEIIEEGSKSCATASASLPTSETSPTVDPKRCLWIAIVIGFVICLLAIFCVVFYAIVF
ncbi:hypothetical protein FRACYDRAFT_249505 [Fragilariopsis cylindrus CCMP1102]|uniref:Uncharacterized protein n=1 Tax=Fragilariopsis cylindrus CCMP1102 TaxID=635003 RepID=A0A1E7ESS7_9STRA|nr:hypothetical protein FRACYDRAFT_249505 [Fragilariopsis cylindrus CCMP1102]|eukprot:OEU08613.1 hypothetical protein FRACYDRAFT_249505 [Fragilariopsis cylindrus CCMP1102]